MNENQKAINPLPVEQIVSRFLPLPYANDPAAFPLSNWATSYHCDVCDCADYDQTHEGKDIMPFYRDMATGDLVCDSCRANKCIYELRFLRIHLQKAV